MWSVITRFPASRCFNCHYYLIRVLTLFCARFHYTAESASLLPDHQIWLQTYNNFKQRSPRVLLTPVRLPSVSTLHLPGVSCEKLFTTTKVKISPLHFSSRNSTSPSIFNSVRTAKSFRLSYHIINRRFSTISTCNARRCLTCHYISCESTITSSINSNRYGIKID